MRKLPVVLNGGSKAERHLARGGNIARTVEFFGKRDKFRKLRIFEYLRFDTARQEGAAHDREGCHKAGFVPVRNRYVVATVLYLLLRVQRIHEREPVLNDVDARGVFPVREVAVFVRFREGDDPLQVCLNMLVEVERFFEFDDSGFLTCAHAREYVRKHAVDEIVLLICSEQAEFDGLDFEYARKPAVFVHDTVSVDPLVWDNALNVRRVFAFRRVFLSAENVPRQVKSAFVNALLTDGDKQRNKQAGNAEGNQ